MARQLQLIRVLPCTLYNHIPNTLLSIVQQQEHWSGGGQRREVRVVECNEYNTVKICIRKFFFVSLLVLLLLLLLYCIMLAQLPV